jgi:4-carboxymuconolactone decarboxylase
MTTAQLAASESIISGPRKAIFGSFVPLLHSPERMECIGKAAENLRFNGVLLDRIREIAICGVARETENQFEWQTHAPLAVKAGIAEVALRCWRRVSERRWPGLAQRWTSTPPSFAMSVRAFLACS